MGWGQEPPEGWADDGVVYFRPLCPATGWRRPPA